MTYFIHLTLAKPDIPYHEILMQPQFIITMNPLPHDEEGAKTWVSSPTGCFKVTETVDEILGMIQRAEAVN